MTMEWVDYIENSKHISSSVRVGSFYLSVAASSRGSAWLGSVYLDDGNGCGVRTKEFDDINQAKRYAMSELRKILHNTEIELNELYNGLG